MLRRPPTSPIFPYTTLFRSHTISLPSGTITTIDNVHLIPTDTPGVDKLLSHLAGTGAGDGQDRKHTRLNFSHVETLYAVVCPIKTIISIGCRPPACPIHASR